MKDRFLADQCHVDRKQTLIRLSVRTGTFLVACRHAVGNGAQKGSR